MFQPQASGVLYKHENSKARSVMRTSARRNLKRILSFARDLSTNDIYLVAWQHHVIKATWGRPNLHDQGS